VRARVSPARPGDGPGRDPVAASCGLWSFEFPWVDQFDPGSGEVIGAAGRQRRFGSAADGRDLGVGHADGPPERFPAAGDIGVPRGAALVEGQDPGPEVGAEQVIRDLLSVTKKSFCFPS